MNSRWTTAFSFESVQICSEFQKTDHTKRLYGFRSTKPENFRSKTWATRLQKARQSLPQRTRALTRLHLNSRAFMRRRVLTRWHASWRHGWRHHPLTGWPVCPDDPVWPGPTRKSDPVRTAWNLLKKKKKRFFDLDQKVKIFDTDLSHSIFRVHSDFGTRFFIRKSEIVQMSNFQKSWLLCKCWPNVKIFKMDLSCSIFRVHSDFGVRSVIWDSEIAKMTQFQVFKT